MARREDDIINQLTTPTGATWGFGTAAPTTGTYKRGSIVYNTAPSANGNNVGWICTAAGTPGTWKAFGSVAA